MDGVNHDGDLFSYRMLSRLHPIELGLFEFRYQDCLLLHRLLPDSLCLHVDLQLHLFYLVVDSHFWLAFLSTYATHSYLPFLKFIFNQSIK